ncbi:TPA: hypothetical protein ACGXMH_001348 [Bacillus mobilis]|uniref:hypothetical protein n=1 Tax=Bacillus mobilis TaxID=2026190 RepID=UPI00119D292F|nr:hypothetical protein [Bacillus mobilis]MED4385007.1 hypothetical protein [Bacillus mobilis]HDX9638973.1 hypothetical protein [Bacillus mobilis]
MNVAVYFHNEVGEFTHMDVISPTLIPVFRTEKGVKEEVQIIEIPEKLCEAHMGKWSEISKEECPDCILAHFERRPVEIEYTYDVIDHYKEVFPPNCTTKVCPDGIYHPKFVDGDWVKTIEPEFEYPKEEPSEIEKIKKQQELMKQAMDEMIIQNPTPDEVALVKKRLVLMQSAIDDLIISTTPTTIEGGSN